MCNRFSEQYSQLVTAAARQLRTEGQIDLILYAEIEEAGFDVNNVVDRAEAFNSSL